jgi:carbamoyl-phosphate synthase large subunit
MPKRNDLQKILLIGAGPVVIGRGTEFDYAGVRACKTLKQAGCEVTVIDSNPAGILTDRGLADQVYIEPLTVDNLEKIITRENPGALLLNYGGRIAFGLGNQLVKSGFLGKHGVQLIGIPENDLDGSQSYRYFRSKITSYNIKIQTGHMVSDHKEGMKIGIEIGFPLAIRSFDSPEGTGTSIAYNQEELDELLPEKFNFSPAAQVLLEESMLGWKEFAVEILRDETDNCIVAGCLEQIDPMGIHSGDSVAVTPPQTLSPAEYHNVITLSENAARAIELVGSAGIKIAQNPADKDFYVFKINRAFTRNTAMIAKATGLQIVDIATKLMVGYHLKELTVRPEITGNQPQADYVAVKLPRFDYQKFPTADHTLNTVMKSTGETMAVGQNFKEAFQKGLRSLEIGMDGFTSGSKDGDDSKLTIQALKEKLANPDPTQFLSLYHALKSGYSIDELNRITKIDAHFLKEFAELVSLEKNLTTYALYNLKPEIFIKAKQWGFSDTQITNLLRTTEAQVREARQKIGITPVYNTIVFDSGDIKDNQALHGINYSTYSHIEISRMNPDGSPSNSASFKPDTRMKVIILGPGPHRIDRGGEFEYSLIHAALALQDMGYESIIINNNPGALSTDPSFSDQLYCEPLTGEELGNIILQEQPLGVVSQFGGLPAAALGYFCEQAGVKILDRQPGPSSETINLDSLQPYLKGVKVSKLPGGTASDPKSAIEIANYIGYPVMISSAVPGSAILPEVAFDAGDVTDYFHRISKLNRDQKSLFTIEKFLEDAIAVEVGCITDGTAVIINGVMEQIEQVGISSEDSALALPPYTLGAELQTDLKTFTTKIALELKTKGLLNLQYVIKHNLIYLRSVSRLINRLVPVIVKATGIDWLKIAIAVFMGKSLKEQGIETEPSWQYSIVKEAVFSFERFPGVDTILGPEIRSTGEVIGIGKDFGLAFIKSQLAAGAKLPTGGTIFLSVKDEDKRAFIPIVKQLAAFGFKILATAETALILSRNNIPCQPVKRVGEGRPNIIDKIKNGEVQWIFNTPADRKARRDESLLRSTAAARNIPIITTVAAAQAVVTGLERYLEGRMEIRELNRFLKPD